MTCYGHEGHMITKVVLLICKMFGKFGKNGGRVGFITDHSYLAGTKACLLV